MDTTLSRRNFLSAAVTASAATAIPINIASATSAQAADKPEQSAYMQPTAEGELVIGSLDDLEVRAAEVILEGAFAFISSGADNQVTLRQNRKALDRIRLLPHYLVNKPAPDLSTTLLGHKLSMPIITAPMGAHGLAHKSAELGSAKVFSDN